LWVRLLSLFPVPRSPLESDRLQLLDWGGFFDQGFGFRLIGFFEVGPVFHVLGYDGNFGVVFAVVSGPSILLQPAYHTDTPAFPPLVAASVCQFSPGFNVKKADFLFKGGILMEIPVRRN
jgi:hypothetical protein